MQDPVLSSFRIEHRPPTPRAEVPEAEKVEEGGADAADTTSKVGDGLFLEATRLATEEEEEGGTRIINFEVDASKVKEVKERCSKQINWPLLEEYDFRNDTSNPELPIELRNDTQIREYQSKALSRMFSSHRARSGIIVLPCGAGKTLVGIVAATTVKRSCLVLCNSSARATHAHPHFLFTKPTPATLQQFRPPRSADLLLCPANSENDDPTQVSVEQWYAQFRMWTQIDDAHITKFTATHKAMPHADCCVLVSTYNMISFSGRRSREAEEIMQLIREREASWTVLNP